MVNINDNVITVERPYEKKNHRCKGCPIAITFEDGKRHKTERKAAATDGRQDQSVDISQDPGLVLIDAPRCCAYFGR